MTLQMLKILNEMFRTACHYYNHTNAMIADNMDADALAQDIPYSGTDYREVSKKYHKKFDQIKQDIEDALEVDAIVAGGEKEDDE